MKHTYSLQAYLNGAWTEVGGEALTGYKTKIIRGLTEQGELRPCKITWTFKDPTDKWRPTNPLSPLYGVVGLNTPYRVTVDGFVRAYGEASSYEPDQDIGGPQTMLITAEGVQRRVGKWTEKLRSPIYRQLSAQPLAAYWPMEDGSSATSAASAVPDNRAASVIDTDFGDDDCPPGAAACAVMRTAGTSRIAGQVRTWPVALNGYSALFYIKLPAAPAGAARVAEFRATGTVTRWLLDMNATPSWILTGYAESGVAVVSRTVTVSEPVTDWIAVQLETEESGASTNYALIWHRVGGTSFWSISGTYGGNADRLTTMTLQAPVNDTRVCHLWGGDDSIPFVDGTFQAVSDGYRGELAGNRWARLMTEAGLDYATSGDLSLTMPMGPQRSDTFINLLKEIRDTEDALIYDSRGGVRMTFKTRTALYRQSATLALTWPDDIAPPFREKIDDQGVWNTVTVKNRDGGEASAVRTSGPLSIQPPPAGVGEYRQDVDVNVASEDELLPLLSGWWLARGTAYERRGRYTSVTIDLDARPDLATAASNVEIGNRITIAGRDPDVIGLIVLGIEETVETYRRLITFTGIPDTVWSEIGQYNETAKRYDDAQTTLQTGRNATDTAWTFTYPTPSNAWSTKVGSLPYDVMVAGERVRVTAMGARTGSGPYTQAATVTRSINGVIKSQTAGTSIRIATPARYAL